MRDKYTEAVTRAVREHDGKSIIVTENGVVKISSIYTLHKSGAETSPPSKVSIYAPFSLKLSGGGLLIWSYYPDRWAGTYTDRAGGQVEIRDVGEIDI